MHLYFPLVSFSQLEGWKHYCDCVNVRIWVSHITLVDIRPDLPHYDGMNPGTELHHYLDHITGAM